MECLIEYGQKPNILIENSEAATEDDQREIVQSKHHLFAPHLIAQINLPKFSA